MADSSEEVFISQKQDIPADFSIQSLWRVVVANQQQLITFQQMQIRHQQEVHTKLDSIKDVISQAKGGWKVALAFGGIVATISSAIAWLYVHVTGINHG